MNTLKIGKLELSNNVILAPMAGITDFAFRTICKEFGCAMVCSEMISSKALHYEDKKTYTLLKTDIKEKPFSVQIFGSEPEIMAEAAIKIEKMNIADVIDINMGCPAPKIVNNNDGSALMKDIKLAERILRAVKEVTSLPVTVKFRKGWDTTSENYIDFGLMCEDCNADAVTLHARTRSQHYSGKADWDAIALLKQNLKIPVIGNGDVFCHYDINKMLNHTKADGVMIGRGALGNPFIFNGSNPDISIIKSTALKHLTLLNELKGEHIAVLEARKHMAWYVKGFKNATLIKKEINTISSIDSMKKLIENL